LGKGKKREDRRNERGPFGRWREKDGGLSEEEGKKCMVCKTFVEEKKKVRGKERQKEGEEEEGEGFGRRQKEGEEEREKTPKRSSLLPPLLE
jgi:hypothetical protein